MPKKLIPQNSKKFLLVLFIALLSGGFLFGLSLLTAGIEWWISEINAEIIYAAITKYKVFPFFSYFHNGGSMILQDPQGHLLSPATLFIILFGPQIGLRVMALVWGFVGCIATYYWLRSKIGGIAALFAASAWTLSMVFIWNIVNGNDILLWYLGLPLFLIAIEKIVLKPSWRATSISGLLVALFILGPSFHALLYLIIPISIVWFIFLLFKNYQAINKKQLLIHCLTVIGIGAIISLPKIYSWMLLDMSRITDPEGSIYLKDAFLALFDIRPSSYSYMVQQKFYAYHYIFSTSNVALPPIASILAIIGLLFGWKKKYKQKILFIFACSLLLIGILISSNEAIWQSFRWLTGDSFRHAARFLAISAFGLAILSGIGVASILEHFSKYKKIISSLLIASTFIFGIIWVNQATHYEINSISGVKNVMVKDTMFSLYKFDISWIKTDATNKVLTDQITFKNVSIIGSGAPEIDEKEKQNDIKQRGGQYYLSPELAPDGRIRVYHTSITAKDLQPEEIAHIRLNPAPLGETIHTTPENANVTLEIIDDELVLTNHENYAIEMVEIKPNSPVHPA
ncbi:MAG: hypothetical protein Q8P20_07645, partial [bacterium]|nr:hypothetical protein [bacterium]